MPDPIYVAPMKAVILTEIRIPGRLTPSLLTHRAGDLLEERETDVGEVIGVIGVEQQLVDVDDIV